MASRDFDELTRNAALPLIGRGAASRCAMGDFRGCLGTLQTVNRRCDQPVGADFPRSRALLRAAGVTWDAHAWEQS